MYTCIRMVKDWTEFKVELHSKPTCMEVRTSGISSMTKQTVRDGYQSNMLNYKSTELIFHKLLHLTQNGPNFLAF